MIKKVCELFLVLAMVMTMIGTAMTATITIYTNDGAGGVKESRLLGGFPNFPGNDGLRLGSYGLGFSEGPHRMLLKFDLSSIPSANHVASATVNFNNEGSWSAAGMIVDVHKVTQAWNPQSTSWNNQPEFETLPAVSLFQPWGSWSFTEWDHAIDVTGLVKGWVADPSSNYGMLLKQHDEVVPQDMWWIISSYSQPANPSRPALVVSLLSDTEVLFEIVGNLEARVEALEETGGGLSAEEVQDMIEASLAPVDAAINTNASDIDAVVGTYNTHTHDKGSGSRNTSAPVPQIQ